MRIRPMVPEDHAALLALWRTFPGNALTGADDREEFISFLHMNRDLCFVLEEDGRVAGSVMAGQDGRRGYVYHLAVRADLQGTGAGKALMMEVESALATAGIEKAHLFIFSDNPAIGFYEKLGWHLRGDIEVMSKVLSGPDPYVGTRTGMED